MGYRTEDVRDSVGKLKAVRVFVVDAIGREFSTDVPVEFAAGVSIHDIVSAVASVTLKAVVTGSLPPNLTTAQVKAIADKHISQTRK